MEITENGIVYVVTGDYPDGRYIKTIKNKGTVPVALNVLSHDKWSIMADSTSIITLTYTANEAVCFVVNDDIYVVEPIDQIATLEITADAVGPIRVEVRGQTLILAATEVS